MEDSMKVRHVRVDSALGPQEAEQAVCACGSETFLLYQVRTLDGVPHQHVQCAACDHTYCDGTCGDSA